MATSNLSNKVVVVCQMPTTAWCSVLPPENITIEGMCVYNQLGYPDELNQIQTRGLAAGANNRGTMTHAAIVLSLGTTGNPDLY